MTNRAKVNFLLLLLILETTSNLLQPEYSVKIVNTENIILSLGNLDENDDDLELIREKSDPVLDSKMLPFHKYVNLLEKERQAKEKSEQKFYRDPTNLISEMEISNEDLPFSITEDKNLRKIWERRKKRKWNRKKNFRKKLSRHMKFRKYKRHRPGVVKRELPANSRGSQDDVEYDYLANDYWDYVNKSLANNTAFRYSEEGKPEESVKDVINKITDVKTPKNCSKVVGLGVQAVECAMKDFRDKEINTKEMMRRISIIILIWMGIYMMFAIPLWCSKGWCCCCFRCEFCLPVTTVQTIQKYLAENPPGVYINENGEEEHYNPTAKETELYERLTRSIADF